MIQIVRTSRQDRDWQIEGVKYVSREEGLRILDQHAREQLGMSGEEFIRKYQAGEIEDPSRPEVDRVAILLPLTED